MLLDSDRDCPRCEDRQLDRRAQRRAVAAAVDAAMPHACEAERRAATEQRLHQDITAQAGAREREWEHVRAQQAAVDAAAAQREADGPAAPVAAAVLPAPRPAAAVPVPEPGPEAEAAAPEADLVLEELAREEVIDWRARAARGHQLVFDHIDHIDRYGEPSARRLFTGCFVEANVAMRVQVGCDEERNLAPARGSWPSWLCAIMQPWCVPACGGRHEGPLAATGINRARSSVHPARPEECSGRCSARAGRRCPHVRTAPSLALEAGGLVELTAPKGQGTRDAFHRVTSAARLK
ncbi:hypothetical protein MUU72_33825 [Streptomyces sp. RS10V-4]|uniref:hypothetical protein n=1 Tax=Streptomyces rhizoryzae TaxID=2932493 RepID=UPI0020033849|nr:hypothetical protein [Streptomyces rhizoryzae]MCK7628010.1 hypothetical protein [Streptomyces rhizoryzae]